jgi:NitT/TauT family transport system substrate-binding protein
VVYSACDVCSFSASQEEHLERTIIFSGLVACNFILPTTELAAQTIMVGTARTISDAPLYIAEKKGYFRLEGLDVELRNFRSAADIVSPLRNDQIQAGAASVSAGFFNAIAGGIKIKIVADKGSSVRGYGSIKILVRKDLVESGSYRTLKDLKKMTFAVSDPGAIDASTLNALLKSLELRYSTDEEHSDVKLKYIPSPDHTAALKDKLVEASASVEPHATKAIREGYACLIKSDDEIIHNHQIAILFYSEKFAQRRSDEAKKFMRAYIRAIRFYNDALRNGQFEGPTSDEVVSILSKATSMAPGKKLSDRAYDEKQDFYKSTAPIGMDPDGWVNKQSLDYDLTFYREQAQVKDKGLNLDDLVDNSFVRAAHEVLGRYKVQDPQTPAICSSETLCCRGVLSLP